MKVRKSHNLCRTPYLVSLTVGGIAGENKKRLRRTQKFEKISHFVKYEFLSNFVTFLQYLNFKWKISNLKNSSSLKLDPYHVLNRRKFVLASHGYIRQVCVTWHKQKNNGVRAFTKSNFKSWFHKISLILLSVFDQKKMLWNRRSNRVV